MDNIREGAYRLIKTVASPLHFFVVAALVMGIIIVVLVWKAKLPPDVTVLLVQKISAMNPDVQCRCHHACCLYDFVTLSNAKGLLDKRRDASRCSA